MTSRDFSTSNDQDFFVYVRKDLFADTHIWIMFEAKAGRAGEETIQIQTPCKLYEYTDFQGDISTTAIRWFKPKNMTDLTDIIDIAIKDIKEIFDLSQV